MGTGPILGISPLDSTSSACLLIDGEIIGAVSEERFTRKKQQSGFPTNSVNWLLSQARIRSSELQNVVYPYQEWQTEKKYLFRPISLALKHKWTSVSSNLSGFLGELIFATYGSFGHHLRYQIALSNAMRNIGIHCGLLRVEHHLSHAIGAYFASGFEKALVFTLDGYGSGLAGSVFLASNLHLKKICQIPHPNSIGLLYGLATALLGFKPNRHEGKLVGLAAYGNPHISNLSQTFLLDKISYSNGKITLKDPLDPLFLLRLLRKNRREDVIASLQFAVEQVTCKWIQYYIKKYRVSNVAVAGGVFANVKLNQRITEMEEVQKLFVFPPMGDVGTCIGETLYVYTQSTQQRPQSLSHMFLGPDAHIPKLSSNFDKLVPIEIHKPLSVWIADAICNAKIIGVVRGAMEFGPRALGHRSILANVSDPKLSEKLNKMLSRNEFMPFAPAILEEDAENLFPFLNKCRQSTQFMTVALQCQQHSINKLRAAIHVDGTSRIQLISRQSNPFFWELLQVLKSKTGIGAVLNTSFNYHGEPIVCTIKDAISTTIKANLDYLVIEDEVYGRRMAS